MCDLEDIGSPSIFKLIRRGYSLDKDVSHLQLEVGGEHCATVMVLVVGLRKLNSQVEDTKKRSVTVSR